MARTREEVQRLIASWKNDPTWDLEDTEGFEEHREELQAVASAQQAIWRSERRHRERQEHLRRVQQGFHWGCSPEVVAQLERLDGLVQTLQTQVAQLRDELAEARHRLDRVQWKL